MSNMNRHSCEKNWTHTACMPSASGSYGKLAGWHTKYEWILKSLNSLYVKLFGLLLRLISVQCYFSLPFSSMYSIIILRCVLRCVKFYCHFFHVDPYY